MTNTTIQFKVSGKPVKFTIAHNLPEAKGLNITDALNSWLFRTRTFTAKSFCTYIKSKNFKAWHVKMA